MDAFLAHVRRVPLLTPEQEIFHAREAEEGDRRALGAAVLDARSRSALTAVVCDLEARMCSCAELSRDAPARTSHSEDPSLRVALLADLRRLARGDAGALATGAFRPTVDLVRRVASHVRAARADLERADRARVALVEHNLRLVVSFARRQRGRGVPLLDLVQEGTIGLVRAAEKFDGRRGLRFTTYATFWIRESLARGAAEQGPTVHVPLQVAAASERLARARARLEQVQGWSPSDEELAASLELAPDDVERLLASRRTVVSLDAPMGEEGDRPIGDFLADDNAESPHDVAAARELAAQSRSLLERLSPREKEVLVLRFGLEDGSERSLSEIGERIALTRERVRQIEAAALEKLRNAS